MVTWFFIITGFVACYPAQAQAAIHAPRAEHRVCTAEIQHQLSTPDAIRAAVHVSFDDFGASFSQTAIPTSYTPLEATPDQTQTNSPKQERLSAFTCAHPPRGPPLA